MQLSAISIGERVRKDMGDLQALAESIKTHGLLHPVVVRADGTLIAGHRRLEAVRLLGWAEISVTVIEVENLLMAERDENQERKDFTPTEAVVIGRLIEEQHKEKLKATKSIRAAANVAKRYNCAKDEVVYQPRGGTEIVTSAAVGMSPSTYRRARAVVAAAESNPHTFGDLPSQMDETGNVSGAHREMERRKGANGKEHRHPVFKKMHYRKPNQEMERAVHVLAGIAGAIKSIALDQLDTDKTAEWCKSIKESISTISSIVRKVPQ